MASGLVLMVAAAAAVAVLMMAVSDLNQSQKEEGRRQLEESIRRAVVSNYATEGVYPATIEDLQREYGIQIDTERYAVFYEIFADNIMPEITVLAR